MTIRSPLRSPLKPALRRPTLVVAGGALASYLGQVGTSTYFPNQINSGAATARGRVKNKNTEAVTALKLVFPNLLAQDFSTPATTYVEAGNGPATPATITASIEYPSGTFTQVKWAGSASISVAAGALSPVSDACAVSIPANTQYWIRWWFSCSAGILYAEGATPSLTSNALFGEAFETGAALSDTTMGGVITNGGSSWYGPCAVLATTIRPSICFLGDSRDRGEGDVLDATGDLGFPRYLNGQFGVINLGTRGDSPFRFNISHAVRLSLVQYVSHVVCDYGVNTFLVEARSQAQGLADLQALWASVSAMGKKLLQTTTMVGGGTSTDSFATLVNQTVASWDASRSAINDVIRTTPAPLTSYIELADVLESSRNSGKLKVTGAAFPYTTGGGTHPNAAGYVLVRDSGCFTAGQFVR